MMKNKFGKRISIEQVEEGNSLMPKFDDNGLIPVITVESGTELIPVSYTHLTLPTRS